MRERLTTAIITAVSRRPSVPGGDDGDNELMRSLAPASTWVRLDAACGDHALAESEVEIEIVYNMYPVKPVVDCGPSQLRHLGNSRAGARP
jgi:hypothetical protein